MNALAEQDNHSPFEKAQNLGHALKYLERQATHYGFAELASLISTAAVAAREITRPGK